MSVTLHTDFGDLKIELFIDEAPKTCENFLAHCAAGTYNNTKILRNIPNFIVQFGDPTNKGRGGESIWGGYIEDEFHPNLRHIKRGIVSMANSGEPNTNGSQFFITYNKLPSLDGKFTVFGQVINGQDTTLTRMEKEIKVKAKNNKPLQDYYITNVTIHANPIADRES
ncbi:hypothetical protein PACTADRAFT_1322 [Pachysolen tannophilus NRRL Y-2460]|uniref:Peptidyl-prolyl cis-trans isomerase n=1 Tax=Pachysolen tannophilus NRRL Y-2460 TaxID=669874 RepID=A0A1E4TYB5_PACTA|nr:hypothetical protein PACTADRAFT_1322 [Pachysolen tannophilus NRRL Y-2460]